MTMNKVKTLDDLKKMRESLRASLDLREKKQYPLISSYKLRFLWPLAV